ncbi:sensor histidine kinase [Flavobacterium alkalisoli]|uniref:sensor histidine kinase n=1 Tax=Flavobacterium alkalisoli TaxID=2602769 RepID=UPI003A95794B
MKLRTYTLRYLIVALLAIIALWASLFYMVILDEVYDNIDDGLKNSKILITREAYANESILETREFGINQFKIEPLPKGPLYDFSDKFMSGFEYMEYDDDNEPFRYLETVFNDAHGNPYKLTIRASIVEEDELLEDLMTALIALYFMLVVSIGLLNHIILRKVWKSFYILLYRLKNFKLGSGVKFESPDSPVTEFKTLGKELEQVLQRNETVFTSQKQFIENASHELQTPLAISLNKLELILDNNNLSKEQATEISKISDTLNRLVRLNKSLLMLSRIENRQFEEEEDIDYNTLVNEITEEFKDFADYKEVNLTTINAAQLHFTMNKGLATTLINNLLKNAITHTKVGGSVEIIVDKNRLTFLNNGDTSLDKDRIFDRFFRSTLNEQSTGLGLAIVQSIASVYNLTAEYEFNQKHIFRIIFP